MYRLPVPDVRTFAFGSACRCAGRAVAYDTRPLRPRGTRRPRRGRPPSPRHIAASASTIGTTQRRTVGRRGSPPDGHDRRLTSCAERRLSDTDDTLHERRDADERLARFRKGLELMNNDNRASYEERSTLDRVADDLDQAVDNILARFQGPQVKSSARVTICKLNRSSQSPARFTSPCRVHFTLSMVSTIWLTMPYSLASSGPIQ